MWEIQHNNVELGLFQDSDFASDLEDSKSTSGGLSCIFGSHTFVPRSWMCKKQTSVSHSLTEAEIISLDAGLRVDGIPALDLWNLVNRSVPFQITQTNPIKPRIHGNMETCCVTPRQASAPRIKPKLQPRTTVLICFTFERKNVPLICENFFSPMLCCTVFEDNEAVIKMIIKGRSPTMRHVSRTHRVALDWLFDRINLGP